MKFNMEYPENGWLEDDVLPFVMLTFQGRTVKLREMYGDLFVLTVFFWDKIETLN